MNEVCSRCGSPGYVAGKIPAGINGELRTVMYCRKCGYRWLKEDE